MNFRIARLRFIVVFFALAALTTAHAQTVITTDNPPNTAATQAKHYVVLVSLDGFRYDYPAKFGTPHLLALGAAGASAPEGMLPSYPSLTFPNHITLVTGLYPEHHGIVANSFRDPSRPAGPAAPDGKAGSKDVYVYTQSERNGDGTWYTGTPLWVLAEQQGMRAACVFWPGSEAEIQGKRPSYYLKFDNTLDNHKRIDQVIDWLQLPPDQRPHFITLYYYDVDHFAHKHTPDSPETRDAVHNMDDLIGELHTRLDALHLPIDLVVLADHGMATVEPPPIILTDYSPLKNINTVGQLLYAATDADAQTAYEDFRKHPSPKFTAYRRADLPAHLHINENARIGDPVIVANGPYRIYPRTRGGESDPGEHGYDPTRFPDMKAIFFAAGPDIKPGIKLPTFENINVYPFLAKLLDLNAPNVDGVLDVLAPALSNSNRPARIGRDVSAPIITHSVAPTFTKEERQRNGLKVGDVMVRLWVDREGNPTHIQLVRGLGNVLDDKALEAVSHYKFKPALQNGKPVVVELNIAVNFQIN